MSLDCIDSHYRITITHEMQGQCFREACALIRVRCQVFEVPHGSEVAYETTFFP